ncbi:cyclic peptide export ABC transporter [Yeosuana marina]|uniref:cyclic peptide export ABC transporter n=1 Tax=Yeosuana marina TaxID=1565536 RepID=UPI0030C8D357
MVGFTYYFRKLIFAHSLLAIISGLSGFIFIILVNNVISKSMTSGIPEDNQYLLLFFITVVFFFISRRGLAIGVINLSENIYWNIREDVLKLIINAPFIKVKELREEIYSTLTVDASNVTNASLFVANFFSSIVLVLACLIYMAILSKYLFFVSIFFISIGIIVYQLRSSKSNHQFVIVRELEQHFIKVFTSVLDGVKEININPEKGKDIFNKRILRIIKEGKENNISAYVGYLNSQLISSLLFYGLISLILVYASDFQNISWDIIVNFVFVLLYLLGPIVNIMVVIPTMNRGVISIRKLSTLKKELTSISDKNMDINKGEGLKSFDKLEYRNYKFTYGTGKFSIGPINLEINKGEVIFIYGGNGAGKTTLINTLLGLYRSSCGELWINNKLLDKSQVWKIKHLFTPIFSDFHLFDEFYGLKSMSLELINEYLELFEIAKKVDIEENKFSTLDLSTGQRKRLALICALMEDRPILILDEWAADQDPHFRNKFYFEIIPKLSKELNKTIIAITHDDQYFHLPDRLFKMEYGSLIQVSKTKFASSLQQSTQ